MFRLRAGSETDKIAHLNPIHGERPIKSDTATVPTGQRRRRFAAAVVMGVSGSDKPAARAVLAIRPDGVFVDEDALHSPANIAKTRTGEPLGNFDRAPWLSASPAHVDDWRAAESAEGMPCSALKHGYRNAIIERWNEVSLVYFKGSSTLIGKRRGGIIRRRAGWRASSPRSNLRLPRRCGPRR